MNPLDVISASVTMTFTEVYFKSMETEALREFVESSSPLWPTATREQLLAWCHNRYPCGYYMDHFEIGPISYSPED